MNLGRATIKKLFLILSFIALATIAFSENTYAAEQEAVVISEELTRLNELYKEGIITEEEFSKAKSILLNPDAEIEKKEKKKKKKKKTTAAERKRLKEQQEEELKALKEQLREEKIKEMIEEKRRIIAEREKACEEDPKSKDCIDAKIRISNIYNKVRLKGLEARERDKQERKLKKEALKEEREKTKEEKELERKASLEERKRLKAEKAARRAERKRLKAEWKKACSDDPKSKACKDGKPSKKIKNVLKKIQDKLDG